MTNVQDILSNPRTRTLANIIFLILVFIAIFIVPLFPLHIHKLLFNIFFTAIFLMAVLVLEKQGRAIQSLAVILILTEWLSASLQMPVLTGITKLLNIVFFMIIVIFLIIQIARTRKVTLLVIAQAINGYLLLGLVFATLVAIIVLIHPEAYNFPARDPILGQNISYFSDFLYHGFVTFTTLGYGDIVPQQTYSKSLSLLTSVTGQIYVAVIIAMLVGKFASNPPSD